MKRYRELILQCVDGDSSMREVARYIGLPVQSLHAYMRDGTEPRTANLEKMSRYFGESIAALMMEVGESDSVDNRLMEAIRKLNKAQKAELLAYANQIKQSRRKSASKTRDDGRDRKGNL